MFRNVPGCSMFLVLSTAQNAVLQYLYMSVPQKSQKDSGCLPFVRINDRSIMVRVFQKSANQPNKSALTICNSISCNCFRLMRNCSRSVPSGKRRLPLKVVYNFRTDFPENYCSIWLSTKISGFFLLNGKHPSFLRNHVRALLACPGLLPQYWSLKLGEGLRLFDGKRLF